MNTKLGKVAISPFQWLLITFIIEGLIAIVLTILNPGDSKNAFLLGLSIKRWIIILVIIILVLVFSLLLFRLKTQSVICTWFDRYIVCDALLLLSITAIVMLWITFWFPPARLPYLADEIIRIKPVLIYLELVVVEIFIFFHWSIIRVKAREFLGLIVNRQNKIILFSVLIVATLFFALRVLPDSIDGRTGPNSPGSFISPLQLLTVSFLFFILFWVNRKNKRGNDQKKNWDIVFFLLIWVSVFILWRLTPFTCVDDRTAALPPNFICYPQVNDSVFSIGSHYITLGRGVFNHWFTDKPLYLLFLAAGQWIFGPNIDQYLIFQTIIISIIPAILFLVVKRLVNFSTGFLIAALIALLGSNGISTYAKIGGVNVNIENSELFTALLLILFAISLFRFLEKKHPVHYSLISGGVLGLASLTRMNPLFILPVVLVVILFAGRKHFRKAMQMALIFLIGFSLVFIPWTMTANGSDGSNFYLTKIQNVLNYRYSPNFITTSDNLSPDTTAIKTTPTTLTTKTPPMSQENNVIIRKYDYPRTKSGLNGILAHFINNEFQSIAKLPINFTLYSLPEITEQPLWKNVNQAPFWKINFSFENLFVIFITLVIIITGITFSLRKFGVSGLVPLIIQVGYHIGNGFAMTSGGRYLQPVDWVMVVYFGLGIFALTATVFQGKPTPALTSMRVNSADVLDLKLGAMQRRSRQIAYLVGIVLALGLAGFMLPIANIVRNTIATISEEQITDLVTLAIVQNSNISEDNVVDLLADPKIIIIEGIAYHSRYYSSPIVYPQKQVFEITILGDEKVYVSNFVSIEPTQTLTDGSRVIVIGCPLKKVNYWGAETVILRTMALIQLDGEENILVEKKFNFNCK